jgi:hypothetical protein
VDHKAAEERPEAGPESEDDQKNKGHAGQVGPYDLLGYLLRKKEYVQAEARYKGQKGDYAAVDVSTKRPVQWPGYGGRSYRKVVPA